MKHNRFKHQAFTLCHMFCGWQLTWDYKRIEELVRGTLTINILKMECRHDGKTIELLLIASALHSWFTKDLADNHIPESSVKKAELTVEFETERHRGQRDKDVYWPNNLSTFFVGCKLICSSIISTDEKTHSASYEDREEWSESFSI